jgi:hypothetical protein
MEVVVSSEVGGDWDPNFMWEEDDVVLECEACQECDECLRMADLELDL